MLSSSMPSPSSLLRFCYELPAMRFVDDSRDSLPLRVTCGRRFLKYFYRGLLDLLS
jgi:hypothetical protein